MKYMFYYGQFWLGYTMASRTFLQVCDYFHTELLLAGKYMATVVTEMGLID